MDTSQALPELVDITPVAGQALGRGDGEEVEVEDREVPYHVGEFDGPFEVELPEHG